MTSLSNIQNRKCAVSEIGVYNRPRKRIETCLYTF